MKIAVVHNLPAGGMKRALYEQVKRLSRRHRIDGYSFTSSDNTVIPIKKFLRKETIIEYKYSDQFPFSIFSIYFVLPRKYQTIARMINGGNYDVVIVYPCFLTQSPYILQYLHKPSVYICPEPKREFYEKMNRETNKLTYFLTYPFRFPIKWIDKYNVRCANNVISISKFMKKRIDDVYNISSKINYFATDSDLYKIMNTKKDHIVLTVGTLSLHKGFDFIIKSLAKVNKKIRPKLVIAGYGGNEQQYLLKLAEKSDVVLDLKQNVSAEELLRLYNSAKLFLFAAENEPFGLVILEALSAGLFVISTDGGAVKEIITNINLGITLPRDPAVFAVNIEKYLNIKDNLQTERHRYVQKNWNWDDSIKNLEKYLFETVKNL